MHYVLHAPQGDTYADLLFTMIERRGKRPPVTYTTFQARDLGGDTADLFQRAAHDAYERFKPAAMLVGASCTGELIQDDPAGLARALGLPIPVIPLELPSYQRKENWGAAETFYQLVRHLAGPHAPKPGTPRPPRDAGQPPELQHPRPDRARLPPSRRCPRRHANCSASLGIDVNVVAPWQASAADIARLGEADFNVVLYPEIAGQAAQWLKRSFGQPIVATVPIGVGATRDFITEVARLAGVDPDRRAGRRDLAPALVFALGRLDLSDRQARLHLRRRDPCHRRRPHRQRGARLQGRRPRHLSAASSPATSARPPAALGLEALITDDYLEVEAACAALQPELVLGTQMERHIAKRLGIPCAVISAPVHVQDFPARYSPQMGFEGANVIFDSWVHPLMMGLEEHLLGMFRDDFEFHDGAGAVASRPWRQAASTQGPQPEEAHATVSQERPEGTEHPSGRSLRPRLRTRPCWSPTGRSS